MVSVFAHKASESSPGDGDSPFACPFGDSRGLTCVAQQGLGAACAFLLCCSVLMRAAIAALPPDDDKQRTGWRKWCRFVYRVLKVIYPARDHGSEQLQGVRARYRVEQGAKQAEWDFSEKARVVWDCDAAAMQIDTLGFTEMGDDLEANAPKISEKTRVVWDFEA